MKLKRLNKRGFSLVEVVIAMAVVSIVTFTTLSIIYPATDKTMEASAQSNAIYFAADVIECFKATDNSADCFNAVRSRDGMKIAVSYDATTFAGCSTVFQTEKGNCYVGITFYGTEPNKISVLAVDHNGNVLVNETYEKSPR